MRSEGTGKKLTRCLVTLLIFAALYVFTRLTDFECVYLKYFHIICPGCGMTRAVRALLELDLAAAWRCHPMVFAMPVVLLYIALDGRVFRSRALNVLVLSLIGAGFLVNYVIKLVAYL